MDGGVDLSMGRCLWLRLRVWGGEKLRNYVADSVGW